MSINLFSQRIARLQKNLVRNANELVKDASKAFLTEVVNATPVDTGRAVSSWKVGLNFIPTGERILNPGTKGSTASANRSAVLALELPKIDRRTTGVTVYIVNTASYIDLLNRGRSSLAPAGFIDKARLAAGGAIRGRRLLR